MFTMKKGHRPPPAFGKGEEPPKDANGNIIQVKGGFKEPEKDGFNREIFEQSLSAKLARENRSLCEKYEDEMNPEVLSFWKSYGVKKELFDTDFNDGKQKYSIHTPMDMSSEKKYPLLYFSHGGFGTPFQAETAGFSKLIKKEQFIAVYPYNGGYSNEDAVTEFPRIMEEIKKMQYPVDWSRVYAAGFSSGSDATESIGTLWPEYVAAVAPCPGSNAMFNSLCRVTREAYEKCIPLELPMFCMGGTKDFGDAYPFPDLECIDNFNIWAQEIAKVHNYKKITFEESKKITETASEPAKRAIGLDFDRTWEEHYEERDWYSGEFYNDRGWPVIRFTVGEGVPHIMTGCFASVVWDYLKHWSRDVETKELHYIP